MTLTVHRERTSSFQTDIIEICNTRAWSDGDQNKAGEQPLKLITQEYAKRALVTRLRNTPDQYSETSNAKLRATPDIDTLGLYGYLLIF